MPGSPDRVSSYRERAALHARQRDEARKRSAVLARIRLVTFLGGAAAFIWWTGFHGGMPAALLTGALVLAFGALVVVHARVEDRAAWCEAMRTVNARGIAAIERTWDDLPDAPAPSGIDVASHPYAIDLDLFGHAPVA